MSNNNQQPHPLTRTLHHLRRPLAPLVSITTGAPHPSFPRTLLHYHLLTLTELDALAHYYHQRTPTEHSFGYPLPVLGRWHSAPYLSPSTLSPSKSSSLSPSTPTQSSCLKSARKSSSVWAKFDESEKDTMLAVKGLVADGMEREAKEMEVEAKRRRFGRFVGLRGCESPGMEDEEVLKIAMEEWVHAGMRRCAERETRSQRVLGKGLW